MKVDELVGAHMIADRLGYPPERVRQWSRRMVLPAPDVDAGRYPLWYWSRILRWHDEVWIPKQTSRYVTKHRHKSRQVTT